jgi:hypothetical protein
MHENDGYNANAAADGHDGTSFDNLGNADGRTVDTNRTWVEKIEELKLNCSS